MRGDDPISRMRRGQQAAAERQRELMRAEGPRPEQAVAEALAARKRGSAASARR